jgi:hypothetical protein
MKPTSVAERNNPSGTVVNVLMRAQKTGEAPFGPVWNSAVMAALRSVPRTQQEIVLRDLERRRGIYQDVYVAGLTAAWP